jgi:hypothetical protein
MSSIPGFLESRLARCPLYLDFWSLGWPLPSIPGFLESRLSPVLYTWIPGVSADTCSLYLDFWSLG